jgi:hypothetical protein
MNMAQTADTSILAEDEDLLTEAGKLSGVQDTRALVRMALEGLVQKLEYEKDKRELYAHLEESEKQAAAGQLGPISELFEQVDRKIAAYKQKAAYV